MRLLLLLLLSLPLAYANEDYLDGSNSLICSGMWAQAAIPGSSIQPTITLRLLQATKPMRLFYIVFNYRDYGLIEMCGDTTVCLPKGVASNTSLILSNTWTVAQNETTTADISAPLRKDVYNIQETDLYCIQVNQYDSSASFQIKVEYQNPYGLLPASDYSKLPLYGFLSITYLIIGLVWIWRSFMHWRDLLPLQNYLSVVIVFLMIEQAFNYGYYENFNVHGKNSMFLLGVVAILNAARNSISFFILLIVSLGYGVLKPSLGSTMKRCIALAVTHLVFGILYAAGSMVATELSGMVVAFFVLPLSASMTLFYYWTLTALDETMAHLKAKRQAVKLRMYTRLWKILIFSVSVLFIAFAVNAISFYNQGTTFWRPYFWRLRWILLDAWLNVLYLVIFIGILILWRPTENNQRYGLVELAQDDYDEYDAELNEVNHHHYDGREEEDESPKTMVNNINNNNVQVDGGEGGGKRPQQHHQDEEFGEDELFEWAERLPDDH